MGYYTRYTGSVTGPTEWLEEFKKDARNGATFGHYGESLDGWLDGEFFGGDTAKWYECSSDMAALSSKYPALLFILDGEGEEAGDIWRAWARNGNIKMVQAMVVIDEPDLDSELPAPDMDKVLADEKARMRAEIDSKIAELQAERELLE